jgi:hypothetical protein
MTRPSPSADVVADIAADVVADIAFDVVASVTMLWPP